MFYEMQFPPKVHFGKNALMESIDELAGYGKRPLIVTSPSMIRLEFATKLSQALKEKGLSPLLFSEIRKEPSDKTVEAGLLCYREHKADFIIGLGGGSALDTAKAIGVLIESKNKITDFMGKIIKTTTPPMIMIPSTFGTGSEVSQYTIITDSEKGVKMLLKGPSLMPNFAIIDPSLSLSLPKNTTAASGIDALAHAIEAYISKKAFHQTDAYALSAIKRIFNALPIAYQQPDNYSAREEMALASYEAGLAFNNSSVTLVHGMSRPIGALFEVPHGISNAMLLKTCLRFATPSAFARFVTLSKILGVFEDDRPEEINAEHFLTALERLLNLCEIPTLEEYGIDKNEFLKHLDKMATDALASGSPQNLRREVSKADIIELYKALWQ